MIKANELRRGNLVDYTGSFLPIDSIAGDETVRLLVNGSSIGCFSTHLIDPIPLTPEILEKAGFDLISTDMLGGWLTYQKGGLEIQIGFGGVHFKHSSKTTTVLQYVHEIQNLYFALTGNELEIKDL